MTRRAIDSLSDNAYRQLEELIVTLKIAPGSLVTEQDLSTTTGFGRTPVREAVQRLERDMLLRVIPRRGVLIEPIDVQRALMAIDVRAKVEPLLMERAARLADEVERRRFSWLADQMELSVVNADPLAFTRADREFNDLVTQCARHEVASRVNMPLHAIGRRIGYCNSQRTTDHADATAAIHVRLVRSIVEEDFDGITTALAELFQAGRAIALAIDQEVLPNSARRRAV